MPWIWCGVADCAMYEDVVLSSIVPDVQMCSTCVPVHPDVLYHTSIIICYVL